MKCEEGVQNGKQRISEFIEQQVSRMSGLHGFPRQMEAVEELCLALTYAPTETEAERFVTAWLRMSTIAPTPADIYAMYPPEEEPAFKGFSEPACAVCLDTGYVVEVRGGVSGAKQCACRSLHIS